MDDENTETRCCCVVSGVRPSLNAVFSSVQYMHPTPDTASAPRQEVTVAALHPLGDSAAVRTTTRLLTHDNFLTAIQRVCPVCSCQPHSRDVFMTPEPPSAEHRRLRRRRAA